MSLYFISRRSLRSFTPLHIVTISIYSVHRYNNIQVQCKAMRPAASIIEIATKLSRLWNSCTDTTLGWALRTNVVDNCVPRLCLLSLSTTLIIMFSDLMFIAHRLILSMTRVLLFTYTYACICNEAYCEIKILVIGIWISLLWLFYQNQRRLP